MARENRSSIVLIVDVIYAALALLALGKASALFKTRAALSSEAMQQLFQNAADKARCWRLQ